MLAVDKDEALLERKAWKRMISGERPFDLRYGTASPSREEAEAEVDLASAIVTAIHKQRGG